MLIPQIAQCQSYGGKGSLAVGLAELRRELAEPSALSDGNRRRLLELAQRLLHVQALGDGYVRVAFSHFASSALNNKAPTV